MANTVPQTARSLETSTTVQHPSPSSHNQLISSSLSTTSSSITWLEHFIPWKKMPSSLQAAISKERRQHTSSLGVRMGQTWMKIQEEIFSCYCPYC
ncbi:hypothetical protein AOLI_G00158400 [Acnodon oligacanthus]